MDVLLLTIILRRDGAVWRNKNDTQKRSHDTVSPERSSSTTTTITTTSSIFVLQSTREARDLKPVQKRFHTTEIIEPPLQKRSRC